jgi:serine O-acetyltransferase
VPILEDDVAVGRGAAVMGAVHVGKGALIGANSVVLKDVPAGARIGAVTRWL